MRSGSGRPAHCIAGGKVLLAYLEPQLRARLLRSRKLVARTPRSITRVSDLEAELEKVRARGYGTNDEENFDGIVAVAVPILDAHERVVAALTMHGPLPRLTPASCEAAVPRLRQAAQRIAAAWGSGLTKGGWVHRSAILQYGGLRASPALRALISFADLLGWGFLDPSYMFTVAARPSGDRGDFGKQLAPRDQTLRCHEVSSWTPRKGVAP